MHIANVRVPMFFKMSAKVMPSDGWLNQNM